MRKLIVVLCAVGVVGCAEVGKKDLDDLEAKLDAKIAQVAEQASSDLDAKISGVQAKYDGLLTLDQALKESAEKVDLNAKLLKSANTKWVQILRAQRNALKEQLVSLDEQLKALETE